MAKITLIEHPASNPIDDLAEIELFKTQSVTESDFCIGVTTRFNAIQVSCDNWAYSVISRLREATIKLHLENSRIARESRAGDANRPASLTTTESIKAKSEQSLASSGQISGSASVGADGMKLPSFSMGGSVKANTRRATEAVESYKVKSTVNSIEALPGSRWKISDVITETLGGKYEPDEHLCKIMISEGAYSGRVRATLYFYPKDLSIDAVDSNAPSIGRLMKSRPNNVAVAKALVAKHLKELNPPDEQNTDGKIILGVSHVEFRVEEDVDKLSAPRSPNRRKS